VSRVLHQDQQIRDVKNVSIKMKNVKNVKKRDKNKKRL